jgi:hypothetical protein
MKLMRRIAAVTNRVTPGKMREVFNIDDHEATWQERNTTKGHWKKGGMAGITDHHISRR